MAIDEIEPRQTRARPTMDDGPEILKGKTLDDLGIDRYTPEEIRRIGEAANVEDGDKLKELITGLEAMKAAYLAKEFALHLIGEPTDRRDHWSDIQRQAERLTSAVRRVERWGHPLAPEKFKQSEEGERAELLEALESLSRRAQQFSDLYAVVARASKGRRKAAREPYIKWIIMIWTSFLGRELRISRDCNGRVDGPLWRFFEAAAYPVLWDDFPSSETFADFVKAQKKRSTSIEPFNPSADVAEEMWSHVMKNWMSE
ncbi:MAG: hypothetical protein EWM45_06610 [Rhodopseudomonas palustris]|nr:MAG: hypothetical protein EWM45_06610 [Rhodopseudomonas palustris]